MPVYDGLQLIEKSKSGDYLLKPNDQQLNKVLEKTCEQLEKTKQNWKLNDRAKQIVENEYRRKQVQFLRGVLDGKFSGKAALLSGEEMKFSWKKQSLCFRRNSRLILGVGMPGTEDCQYG